MVLDSKQYLESFSKFRYDYDMVKGEKLKNKRKMLNANITFKDSLGFDFRLYPLDFW